jgi:hypothetical protein
MFKNGVSSSANENGDLPAADAGGSSSLHDALFTTHLSKIPTTSNQVNQVNLFLTDSMAFSHKKKSSI